MLTVLCTFRLDSIQSQPPLDVEAAEKQCDEAVQEVRSTLSPTQHYMKPQLRIYGKRIDVNQTTLWMLYRFKLRESTASVSLHLS